MSVAAGSPLATLTTQAENGQDIERQRPEFTPQEFVDHCIESVRTSMEPKMTDLRRRCAEAAYRTAKLGPDATREAVNAVALEVDAE